MSEYEEDPSEFTTPRSGMSLWKRALVKSLEKNVFGKGYSKGQFRAVVLSTPVPMEPSSQGKDEGKWKFFGRIIGPNSPHVELYDDPCDPDYLADRDAADNLISWHTEFRSLSINERPSKGDEVLVKLKRLPVGTIADRPYDLKIGSYLEILVPLNQRAAAYGQEEGLAAEECAAIATAFDEAIDWATVGVGIGGGMVIQPQGGVMSGYQDTSKQGINYFRFEKSLDVLDSSVRADFEAFFASLRAVGIAPQITSARRSAKHQWLLYTKLLPSKAADRPCNSDHQYGFAIDMNATKNGRKITSASSSTRWKEIADIALRHNILWYGYRTTQYDPKYPGSNNRIYASWRKDPVHFQHIGSRPAKGTAGPLDALKEKCRNWFWRNPASGTGANPNRSAKDSRSWNRAFNDNLSYIEPDVLVATAEYGVPPLLADPSAVPAEECHAPMVCAGEGGGDPEDTDPQSAESG